MKMGYIREDTTGLGVNAGSPRVYMLMRAKGMFAYSSGGAHSVDAFWRLNLKALL